MDEYIETIQAVTRTLHDLFKDKDRLTGVDDWDALIGCLVALERIAAGLQEDQEKTEE